ncbi:MAG: hypothetical protein ACRDRS_20300 [Pseudonocardiaceae bacterium]
MPDPGECTRTALAQVSTAHRACEMVPVELAIQSPYPRRKDISMVKAIEKVFTFFVVLILILLLLDLLGPFIANSVPGASDRLHDIMYNIWCGFQNLVHYGPGRH